MLFCFYFRNISTIKGELLPYVVKKQLSKHCNRINKSEKLIEDDEKPDIFNISKESDIENNFGSMSYFSNVSSSEEKIKCYACVIDSNIGIRANTLFDYCKINKIVSSKDCQQLLKDKNLVLIYSWVLDKQVKSQFRK